MKRIIKRLYKDGVRAGGISPGLAGFAAVFIRSFFYN